MGKSAKNLIWLNFWLEGPIDLRTTRPNYILQDIFWDNTIDHIWGAQICIFGQIQNFFFWFSLLTVSLSQKSQNLITIKGSKDGRI